MKYKLLIITLSVLFAFSFHFALAGTATVSWNANTEPDLAGYKVYYDTSSHSPAGSPCTKPCGQCGYASSVDVHNVTSYALSTLTDGQTYYFAVSAYDTSSNESNCSLEVSKTIAAKTYNSVDFQNLVSQWLQTGTGLSADVNSDSVVNSRDLGIMMSHWGS